MAMKWLCACLMVLSFSVMPVFAQDQPRGDDRQPPTAAELVAKIQSKLNLTQDQVTAITPIIGKYASKREAIRQSIEDGTADRDSVRSQMKELMADEKQELAQILSADQMSQFMQMMSQHRHKKDSDSDSQGNSEGDGEGNGNSSGE